MMQHTQQKQQLKTRKRPITKRPMTTLKKKEADNGNTPKAHPFCFGR